jgi:hypothetical protein
MKSVSYYFNGVEGGQQLHENEEMEKLKEGEVIELAGEYWTVLEVRVLATNASADIDSVRVFLKGPNP